MEHIGIDVHKMHSQICILTEDGELIERQIRMGAPSPRPLTLRGRPGGGG